MRQPRSQSQVHDVGCPKAGLPSSSCVISHVTEAWTRSADLSETPNSSGTMWEEDFSEWHGLRPLERLERPCPGWYSELIVLSNGAVAESHGRLHRYRMQLPHAGNLSGSTGARRRRRRKFPAADQNRR